MGTLISGVTVKYSDVHPESGNALSDCMPVSSGSTVPNISFPDCGIYRIDATTGIQNDIEGISGSGPLRSGVNTLDIIIMHRHLLQLRVITDPFVKLAADLDENGQLNVVDLIYMRGIILRRLDLSNYPNKSWNFLPAIGFYNQNKLVNDEIEASSFWGDFIINPFTASNGSINYPHYMPFDEVDYHRDIYDGTSDDIAIGAENAIYAIKMGDLNDSYSYGLLPNGGADEVYINYDDLSNVTVNLEDEYGVYTPDISINNHVSTIPNDGSLINVSLEDGITDFVGTGFTIEFIDPSISIDNVIWESAFLNSLDYSSLSDLYEIDGNKVHFLLTTDGVALDLSAQTFFGLEISAASTGSINPSIAVNEFVIGALTDNQSVSLKLENVMPGAMTSGGDMLLSLSELEAKLGSFIGVADIRVYNAMGALIEFRDLSTGTESVSFSQLFASEKSGIYMIQVVSPNNSFTTKYHHHSSK